MIIKLNRAYHERVLKYLEEDPEFNLFIIGDIDRYGYDNYFLNLWAEINERGEIEGVLLKYFEYLIFHSRDSCNLDGFCRLIKTMNYLEISGKAESVERISRRLGLEKRRVVHFCRLTNGNNLLMSRNSKIKVKKIRFGNLNKIVKLYESINEFENTNTESIKNGLRTGRGYCIEINKQVIAMAKSTSENRTHAMIVGVGTHPNYRNRGFATKCIVKICRELLKERKIPCLFYDNEEAGKIYHKLGFEEIGEWMIYYKSKL
ncbi:GNAT family N-acetyltransferase [Romboutsia weinsteinii]|uniref:GNAT family N-acetyltransferase n=1 Tax=Romboutsia weinsteinii TaxID=2020949 RepID=A0A371J7R6_9FIRM|nr:GNAT family N-acetyltransferase [Romboutsia weinsteinii]RDY28794.1 GNAT family N-acetyltransferase [Romboutsia weinsteinii]